MERWLAIRPRGGGGGGGRGSLEGTRGANQNRTASDTIPKFCNFFLKFYGPHFGKNKM